MRIPPVGEGKRPNLTKRRMAAKYNSGFLDTGSGGVRQASAKVGLSPPLKV